MHASSGFQWICRSSKDSIGGGSTKGERRVLGTLYSLYEGTREYSQTYVELLKYLIT